MDWSILAGWSNDVDQSQLRYLIGWSDSRTTNATNKWESTTGIARVAQLHPPTTVVETSRSWQVKTFDRPTLWYAVDDEGLTCLSSRFTGIISLKIVDDSCRLPAMIPWLITWTMRWTRQRLTVMSLFLDKWCKNNMVENHNLFWNICDIADSCYICISY